MDLTRWKSQLHFRLYLQGHNGLARQRIIDAATNWMWCDGVPIDAVDLGRFLASENAMQLDCLEIKMPPRPWYVELWQGLREVIG